MNNYIGYCPSCDEENKEIDGIKKICKTCIENPPECPICGTNERWCTACDTWVDDFCSDGQGCACS